MNIYECPKCHEQTHLQININNILAMDYEMFSLLWPNKVKTCKCPKCGEVSEVKDFAKIEDK